MIASSTALRVFGWHFGASPSSCVAYAVGETCACRCLKPSRSQSESDRRRHGPQTPRGELTVCFVAMVYGLRCLILLYKSSSGNNYSSSRSLKYTICLLRSVEAGRVCIARRWRHCMKFEMPMHRNLKAVKKKHLENLIWRDKQKPILNTRNSSHYALRNAPGPESVPQPCGLQVPNILSPHVRLTCGW